MRRAESCGQGKGATAKRQTGVGQCEGLGAENMMPGAAGPLGSGASACPVTLASPGAARRGAGSSLRHRPDRVLVIQVIKIGKVTNQIRDRRGTFICPAGHESDVNSLLTLAQLGVSLICEIIETGTELRRDVDESSCISSPTSSMSLSRGAR